MQLEEERVGTGIIASAHILRQSRKARRSANPALLPVGSLHPLHALNHHFGELVQSRLSCIAGISSKCHNPRHPLPDGPSARCPSVRYKTLRIRPTGLCRATGTSPDNPARSSPPSQNGGSLFFLPEGVPPTPHGSLLLTYQLLLVIRLILYIFREAVLSNLAVCAESKPVISLFRYLAAICSRVAVLVLKRE